MKKSEILSYTYDFMRILAEKMEDEPKDVILFGSAAMGNFDSESDIDIFVNVPERKTKSVQVAVNKAVGEFETYALHGWKLKGAMPPIRCIVGDIDSKRWSALRRDIISSGIGLYGTYRELPRGLERHFVFSFTLARLKYKNRVSVVRKLYGYSVKKGGKTYSQAGILERLGGEKINPSVVIVPSESYKALYDFFRKVRATFTLREVWLG